MTLFFEINFCTKNIISIKTRVSTYVTADINIDLIIIYCAPESAHPSRDKALSYQNVFDLMYTLIFST